MITLVLPSVVARSQQANSHVSPIDEDIIQSLSSTGIVEPTTSDNNPPRSDEGWMSASSASDAAEGGMSKTLLL